MIWHETRIKHSKVKFNIPFKTWFLQFILGISSEIFPVPGLHHPLLNSLLCLRVDFFILPQKFLLSFHFQYLSPCHYFCSILAAPLPLPHLCCVFAAPPSVSSVVIFLAVPAQPWGVKQAALNSSSQPSVQYFFLFVESLLLHVWENGCWIWGSAGRNRCLPSCVCF